MLARSFNLKSSLFINEMVVLKAQCYRTGIKSTKNDKIIEIHLLELPDSLPFGGSLFSSDVQNGAFLPLKTNIIQSLFCTIFVNMGTLTVFPR